MNPCFKPILSIDMRSTRGKKKLSLYVAVLIVLSIVVQNGINRYKLNVQDAGLFKEIEGVKPGLFQSYSIYGTYGIRLLSSPPPLSALFPAFLYIAHMDTGVGMTIFNDLKRDGLLVEIKGFAGLACFFLLFVALLQGTTAFENRELMKFYISQHRETPFWAILASRFIRLTLLNTVIFIMAVIQGLANGVWVPTGPVVLFWGLLEIVGLSFLAVGIAADCFLPKKKLVLAVSLFFLSLVVIPWQMDEFNRFRADSFKVELENLKYLFLAEKRITMEAGRAAGKGTITKEILKIIESSKAIEYAQMKANEAQLLEDYIAYVRRKHLFASFFPTTFLFSVSRELSGGGHTALIRFNRFTQGIREKFIDYYFQKEYREKSKEGKVVAFPGDQVFNPGPALPYYNGLGMALSLVYAAGLVFLARWGYRHHLVKVPKKKREEMRDLKIPQKSGVVNDFFTMDNQVKDHIFLEFLNKSGQVTLDEEAVQGPFTYLPALEHLPVGAPALLGIKAGEMAGSWRSFLEAALQRGMVVTDWKLYEYAPEIKDLTRKGVYLNISTDLMSSCLGENHLKWAGDQSIKHLDPYKLAGLLNKHN